MALAAAHSIGLTQRQAIDQLINDHRGRPGALLTVLERIQEAQPRKFLPAEVLRYVAAAMRIPLSRVFSVVTFYAFFNLTPQGDNTVCICRGTACHTRGSRDLLERLKLELGLTDTDPGEGSADKVSLTTPDSRFTVRTVACFGQCALAPVVEINRNIHGHMNEREMHKAIQALR